jgi:transposase InsO family protein
MSPPAFCHDLCFLERIRQLPVEKLISHLAIKRLDGHRFRVLTVVDVCTRESLAVEVGPRLRGQHVVQVLNRLTAQRGAPSRLWMASIFAADSRRVVAYL